MHYDIIATMLPTVPVLTGFLLNRDDHNTLDARLSSGMGRLDARIAGLHTRLHSDMMLVIGRLIQLGVRVTGLEEKQAR